MALAIFIQVLILGLRRFVGWGGVLLTCGRGSPKIESPDFRPPEVIGISVILIF